MLFPQYKYIVDTCSFTALRRSYPLDIFPSAWAKIQALIDDKQLASSIEVYKELEQNDDVVFDMVKKNKHIFLEIDNDIQIETINILSKHPLLIDLKKRKYDADVFVIATAMVNRSSVVSEENPSGGIHRKKIPDVCKEYNIPCIKLLDMLRAEGLKI